MYLEIAYTQVYKMVVVIFGLLYPDSSCPATVSSLDDIDYAYSE